MLVRKKYIFLLVTTTNCLFCQVLKSDVGVDGWNMIKLSLGCDSRLEIIELAVNDFRANDLNGTDKEKLKPLLVFYPAFILMSYDAFHDKNILTVDGERYGYHSGRFVDGYKCARSGIKKWVDETIKTIPSSLVPLNKIEKSMICQLLCLTYMPCSKLGGNCIKNYIPRFLFLNCIVPQIYDNMIWTSC